MITIKQEKGKSLIEVLKEKMATIGDYLGNRELTEVTDCEDDSMYIPATEVRYQTLHTDGPLFANGWCDDCDGDPAQCIANGFCIIEEDNEGGDDDE